MAPQPSSRLTRLPQEILLLVIQNLSIEDCAKLARACSGLHDRLEEVIYTRAIREGKAKNELEPVDKLSDDRVDAVTRYLRVGGGGFWRNGYLGTEICLALDKIYRSPFDYKNMISWSQLFLHNARPEVLKSTANFSVLLNRVCSSFDQDATAEIIKLLLKLGIHANGRLHTDLGRMTYITGQAPECIHVPLAQLILSLTGLRFSTLPASFSKAATHLIQGGSYVGNLRTTGRIRSTQGDTDMALLFISTYLSCIGGRSTHARDPAFAQLLGAIYKAQNCSDPQFPKSIRRQQALHVAWKHQLDDAFETVLDAGIDLNFRHPGGRPTPFLTYHPDHFVQLVGNDASQLPKWKYGYNIVHHLLAMGLPDDPANHTHPIALRLSGIPLKSLFGHSQNPQVSDVAIYQSLMEIRRRYSPVSVAGVWMVNQYTGLLPLHLALLWQPPSALVVKCLLEEDSNTCNKPARVGWIRPDVPNSYWLMVPALGCPPLHMAICLPQTSQEVIRLLRRFGASPEGVDSDGTSAHVLNRMRRRLGYTSFDLR